MITERNVANLLIVKAVNTTVTAGNNIEDSLSGMNVGEAVCLTPGGVILDSAAALPAEFKFAVKLSDGTLQYSDTIKGKSVKSIDAFRTAAATQQVDYIGYNGTDQSINVLNDNIYTVRLYMIPTDIAGFAQQKVKRGVYKSDSTATQGEIAAGLASSLITNLSKEPEAVKYGINNIKVERVNGGADTATSGGTIAVVKGSKYATIAGTGADAGKYNADGATIVAGDVLRFGTTGTLTSPCYVVKSVVSGGGATSMVVELDIPYQGASNSAVAAASVCVVPAATAAAAAWGIKLTGVTYKFDPPKFGYYLPRWKTALQDCGTTVVTNSAAATEGNGTYEEVAYMEQQFQGNEGNFYRGMVPYPTFRTEASSSATYSYIVVSFFDNMIGTLGNDEYSLKQLYFACVRPATATTLTNANTGIVIALERVISQFGCSNNTDLSTEIAA